MLRDVSGAIPMRASSKRRPDLSFIVSYGILTVGALISIMPFVWMVLGSFKPNVEILRMPPTFWPQSPSMDNYRSVVEFIPFFRYYLNSLIVGTVVTVLALFTSSIAGHI